MEEKNEKKNYQKNEYYCVHGIISNGKWSVHGKYE
jgi:hypothetical protein